MSTDDHPDIFAGSSEGPSTAVPLAQPAPPFDPWGMGETAASRAMRQMAAGQEQAARAAAESDRRDAAAREALGAAGDGSESYSHSSKPANAPVEPVPVEESAQEREHPCLSEGPKRDWREPGPQERAAREARERQEQASLEAVREKLATHDADFKVIAFDIAFTVEDVPTNEEYPDQIIGSCTADDEWCVIADDIYVAANEQNNRRLVESLSHEVRSALKPWFARFANMGMVRGDNTFSATEDGAFCRETAAVFYLVARTSDFDDRITSLASWPVTPEPLVSIAGSWLQVTAACRPVNASQLFSALAKDEDPHVGYWAGVSTEERLPQSGESRDEWLSRVALAGGKIVSILDRWEAVGGDPQFFDLFATKDERALLDEEGGWLVENRLQRRVITSIIGPTQVGKSSLAHEIAYALGCIEPEPPEPRVVLGQEVSGRFMVAMVCAEDDEVDIRKREALLEARWGRCWMISSGGGKPRSLADWLERFRALPKIDLLIVEPVRKFLVGDEDSSSVASNFYDALHIFAHEENCAVLVTHHMTKGRPRSLAQMLPMARGSGVHSERPRLIWGMIDRGNGLVEIGPIKISAVGGIDWPLNEGRFFKRDPMTSTLRPLTDLSRNDSDAPRDFARPILEAVRRLNKEGTIVRRTGKSGLFEIRAPELVGISRASSLSTIAEMLDRGDLTDGHGGLVAMS